MVLVILVVGGNEGIDGSGCSVNIDGCGDEDIDDCG